MAKVTVTRPNSGAKMYFTSFNILQDYADVQSFNDPYPARIPTMGRIEFSGEMSLTEGSGAIAQMLLRSGGIDFFQERHEWMCTWCASANPIEHRHCSQCGGPRGWIL